MKSELATLSDTLQGHAIYESEAMMKIENWVKGTPECFLRPQTGHQCASRHSMVADAGRM